MNSPKTFYRELDALLARIGKGSSGKNFLTSILNELVVNFGKELNIYDGAIYEQRDKNFVLVYSSGNGQHNKKLALESPVIQQVIKHGSFIYDTDRTDFYPVLKPEDGYIISTAITINSPERQFLFVFGLRDNWVREEILLFLNAVRTALNYRLFSEIIGGELQQAVQIQKSLLPRSIPKFYGYQIYGHSIPAELVGGDFYEYFEFEEGNFGISIGDASGHGLPAALLVRDVVIGLRMGLASEYKTVHTLKKLNKVIQRSTYASNFVSLFMSELERNGHFFYVNAGHPAPFLIHGDQIHDLGPTGIVLGFVKEIELQRSHIFLEPGSVLVLYTDGIIERQNGQEESYELERLKNLVRENQHKEAKEIADTIFKAVYEFGNSVNWGDDVTLVVVKRL